MLYYLERRTLLRSEFNSYFIEIKRYSLFRHNNSTNQFEWETYLGPAKNHN